MDALIAIPILATIILTTVAWCRGWRGWALIPSAIMVIVFVISVIAACFQIYLPGGVCGLGWLTLLIMALAGRKGNNPPAEMP